jgi:hypothetical protein
VCVCVISMGVYVLHVGTIDMNDIEIRGNKQKCRQYMYVVYQNLS